MLKSISILLIVLILSLSACEQETYKHGRILYENFCENCHGHDGEGLRGLIPPLKNSDYIKNNQDKLPCLIYEGQKDTIVVNGKTYSQAMPGITKLTEFEITNVLNFINTEWNNLPKVEHTHIKELLSKCKKY
jgi:mono/diheme cytochrome c family protein